MLQWVRTRLVWATVDLVMTLCIYIALLFSRSFQIYHLISLLQHLSEEWRPASSLYCPVEESRFSKTLGLTCAPKLWPTQPMVQWHHEIEVTTGGWDPHVPLGSSSPFCLPLPVQAGLHHLPGTCLFVFTATSLGLSGMSVSNLICSNNSHWMLDDYILSGTDRVWGGVNVSFLEIPRREIF